MCFIVATLSNQVKKKATDCIQGRSSFFTESFFQRRKQVHKKIRLLCLLKDPGCHFLFHDAGYKTTQPLVFCNGLALKF